MADIVVDTNVWVMANRVTSIDKETPKEVAECIKACYSWLLKFFEGDDRLVVDLKHQVLTEYRNNIEDGGIADNLLNQLESQPLKRLAYKQIEFDEDGYAILPVPITFDDPDDRKFVALAMTFNPYATIYNATDTDWAKEVDRLTQQGFTIYELCPDYIQSRWTDA